MLPECYSFNESSLLAAGFMAQGEPSWVSKVGLSAVLEVGGHDAETFYKQVFSPLHIQITESQKPKGFSCSTSSWREAVTQNFRDRKVWFSACNFLIVYFYFSRENSYFCVCVCVSTSSWPMASVGCSLSISGLPAHSRELSRGTALPVKFFPRARNWRSWRKIQPYSRKYNLPNRRWVGSASPTHQTNSPPGRWRCSDRVHVKMNTSFSWESAWPDSSHLGRPLVEIKQSFKNIV